MNKILAIPISVIMMIIFGCNGIINSNKCDKIYVKYTRFVESGEKTLLDSIAFLEEASKVLKKDKSCLDALVIVGELYFGFDSLQLAENFMNEAVLIDSSKPYFYYQLGVINYFAGRYKKASSYLRKAIFLKVGDGGIIFEWSPAYMTDEQRKYNIGSDQLYYWAGLSHYAGNDFSSAVDYFTACINRNYNMADSYLYRGLSYHYLGKKEECCIDIFQSFSKGSNDAGKYYEELCK